MPDNKTETEKPEADKAATKKAEAPAEAPAKARASGPTNLGGASIATPPHPIPKDGADYEVRTREVKTFRKVGIDFGPDPVVVDGSSLTYAQKVDLLAANGDTLFVKEIGGRDYSEQERERLEAERGGRPAREPTPRAVMTPAEAGKKPAR